MGFERRVLLVASKGMDGQVAGPLAEAGLCLAGGNFTALGSDPNPDAPRASGVSSTDLRGRTPASNARHNVASNWPSFEAILAAGS